MTNTQHHMFKQFMTFSLQRNVAQILFCDCVNSKNHMQFGIFNSDMWYWNLIQIGHMWQPAYQNPCQIMTLFSFYVESL